MNVYTTLMPEAWLWLGGAFLLAVLWANLSWLFAPWAETEGTPGPGASLAEKIVYHLANWRFAPSLFQGLRLLYYVGLPSAALFWGQDAVVGRFLGLKRLILPKPAGTGASSSVGANWSTWAHDLGWTVVLGFGALGLLLLIDIALQKALHDVESARKRRQMGTFETIREALYHEIHWAFYRNAPIVALGTYWGTWAGLALVAIEAASNPAWRRALWTPTQSWSPLSRGALSVVSCVLFLHAQNLWLALLVHWGISWTLGMVHTAKSPAPSDTVTVGE